MIKIEHNINEAITKIQQAEKKFSVKVEKDLVKHTQILKFEMQTLFFSGEHGRQFLNKKTGKAKNSWKIKLKPNGSYGLEVDLFSDVPYIEIHETQTHRLNLRKWWVSKVKEYANIIHEAVT
jgi:hypothetical protein